MSEQKLRFNSIPSEEKKLRFVQPQNQVDQEVQELWDYATTPSFKIPTGRMKEQSVPSKPVIPENTTPIKFNPVQIGDDSSVPEGVQPVSKEQYDIIMKERNRQVSDYSLNEKLRNEMNEATKALNDSSDLSVTERFMLADLVSDSPRDIARKEAIDATEKYFQFKYDTDAPISDILTSLVMARKETEDLDELNIINRDIKQISDVYFADTSRNSLTGDIGVDSLLGDKFAGGAAVNNALESGVIAGLGSMGAGIASTLDVTAGNILKMFGWEDNPISLWNAAAQKSFNAEMEESQMAGVALGDTSNISGTILQVVTAMIPDAILAYLTMGKSVSSSGTLKAIASAGQRNAAMQAAKTAITFDKATTPIMSMAKLGSSISSAASKTITTTAKNPFLWSSFTRTYGNDYQQALEDGASQEVAYLYATVTSGMNALVEMGGGIQVLPSKLQNKTKSEILEWITSTLEEGGEEVVQSLISDINAKLMYDHDKEIISSTNEDAIINPSLALDYGLGVLGGGIMGGGQIAVGKLLNPTSYVRLGKNVRKGFDNDINGFAEYAKTSSNEEIRNVAESASNGKISDKELGILYSYVVNDVDAAFNSVSDVQGVNRVLSELAAESNSQTLNTIIFSRYVARLDSIDPQTVLGYNNDTNVNQENGGSNDVGHQSGEIGGSDSQRTGADTGTESEGRRTRTENERDFVRRITRASQKGKRRIRRIGDTFFAYTPKKADGSQASMAVELLNQIGISAVYCNGYTESNCAGVTTFHNLAVTAPDGTVYVSDNTILDAIQTVAHEAVHFHQKQNSQAYIDYELIICQNVSWGSKEYAAVAKEIFEEYHRSGKEKRGERKLTDEEIDDIISSPEYVSLFLTEFTACVNQAISGNATGTMAKFAPMFSDWGAVVEASRKFNEAIGLDFSDVDTVATVTPNAKNDTDAQFDTNAVTRPLSDYSAERQGIIKSFIGAVDEKLKSFVQSVKNGDLTFKRQKISNVSERAANDIGNLLGIDVRGYTNNINTSGVQHILNRHGANGKQDTTMSLDDDIARVGWVLENYDNVDLLIENGEQVHSSSFMDKDNNPAPQIRFTKRIDGTYYVVEAAFENDYKKLWVQSVYLQKNEDVTQASAAGNETNHGANAQSALVSPSSNNTVPQSEQTVNNNIPESGTENSSVLQSNANEAGKAPSKEASPTGGRVLDMPAITVRQQNYIRQVGKALGLNVEFVNMEKFLREHDVNTEGLKVYPDGAIDGKGNVYIAYNTKRALQFVFKHELTHFGERSKHYKAFVNVVRESKVYLAWLKATTKMENASREVMEAELMKRHREARNGLAKLSYDAAMNEIIADFVGEKCFGENLEDINELVSGVTEIKEKNAAVRFLHDFFLWLKNKLAGHQLIRDEISLIEQNFAQMLTDTDRNTAVNEKTTTEDGGVKYSINDGFYADFDAWDGKDTNKVFTIGTTSEALKSVNIKNQEIKMRSGMILQKLSKHPEMSRDIFRSIPDLLENPIIVQFSDAIDPNTGKPKYDSRITVLGELYADMNINGKTVQKPVLVSLELLPTNQKKTKILDVSFVTSAYGHSKLQSYLNDNSILYIEPNKKRTDKWLSLNRLQLPLGENRTGPIRRITYSGGKVKIQNSTKKTEMQLALEKAGVINSYGNSIFTDTENDTSDIESFSVSTVEQTDGDVKTDFPSMQRELLKKLQNGEISGGRVLDMPAITVRQQNYIRQVGKALGLNVEFVNMEKFLREHDVNTEGLKVYPDGAIDGKGNVYIAYNTKRALQFVFKHELTHFGERSKHYKAFVNVVRESKVYLAWLKATTKMENASREVMEAELMKRHREARNGLAKLSYDAAMNEIIADFVGEKCFGENLEDINELVSGVTEIKEKNAAVRFLHDFFLWLKNKLAGHQLIRDEISLIEQNFAQMLADTDNTKTSTENGRGLKYSIATDSEGVFVRIDTNQEVFDGKSTREMQDIARKLIRDNFRGKVLSVGEDGKAFISKRSSDEYAYPANRRMEDGLKESKMRAAPELDNLLSVSEFIEHQNDDGRHPQATEGWDVYSTRFEVGGTMFSGEVKIMVTDRGYLFHDITKIKRLPVNGGLTENNSAAASGNPSMDSITDNGTPVNSNSMQNGLKYSVVTESEPDADVKTDFPSMQRELLKKLQNGEISGEEYAEKIELLWEKALEEAGEIKPGEKVSAENKDIPVPKSVKEGTKVRQHVRTILESGKATAQQEEWLKAHVLSGELSYTPTSDKKRIKDAENTISKLGYQIALNNWQTQNGGVFSSDQNSVAMGEALLVQAFEQNRVVDILNLTAEVAELGTRTAQNLQAMKLLKRMGGIGQLVYVQKCVNRLNQDINKRYKNRKAEKPFIKLNEALAGQLAESQTAEEFEITYDAIMRDIAEQVPPTFLDKFNAWRYFAMLFNSTTHIRNFVGNAIFYPAVRMKNILAAGAELTQSRENRTKAVAVKKAYSEFASRDFDEIKEIITGGGKFNPADAVDKYRRIFKTKWLEAARKFNMDMLEREDLIFLKAHYVHALGGYLQAQGISLDGITSKQLAKARDYAAQEALKATYRDASKVANVLSQLSHSNRFVNVAIEGVLPFKKTPINIVKRGIEYSPVGLIKTLSYGIYKLSVGEMTADQFIDGLASGSTGLGVFLLGMLLSSLGVVKGGFDDDEKWYRQLNGEQEYSVEIAGHSYSISWAAPLCIPFFMGVAIAEYEAEEDGDPLSATSGLLLAGFDPVLELSCLSGINDAIENVRFAMDGGSVPQMAINAAGSYTAQLLPTFGGKLANLFDSTRRTKYIDKTSDIPEAFQEALDKILSKTPFLSMTRAEYINAWGETQYTGNFIQRFFQQFVSPGYAQTVNSDEVSEEIMRLYRSTGLTAMFPETPEKYFKLSGERRDLSKTEYFDYATFAGQLQADLVNEAIHNEEYDKLTDEQKVTVLSKIYSYSKALAKSRLSYSYDEIAAMEGTDKNGKPILSEEKYSRLNAKARQMLVDEYFMRASGNLTAHKLAKNGRSVVEYYIQKAKE